MPRHWYAFTIVPDFNHVSFTTCSTTLLSLNASFGNKMVQHIAINYTTTAWRVLDLRFKVTFQIFCNIWHSKFCSLDLSNILLHSKKMVKYSMTKVRKSATSISSNQTIRNTCKHNYDTWNYIDCNIKIHTINQIYKVLQDIQQAQTKLQHRLCIEFLKCNKIN